MANIFDNGGFSNKLAKYSISNTSGIWSLRAIHNYLASLVPASVEFNGSITSATSINGTIDMGIPETGDIQVFAVVGQTISVPTAPTGITEIFDTGLWNTYDRIIFYKLNVNQSGNTQFTVNATYRVSVFAWTIKAGTTTLELHDTGYNNSGVNIETLNTTSGGCVLAAHTSAETGVDVSVSLVSSSDVSSTVVESPFEVSAGHTTATDNGTLSMRVDNDTTVSRTLVGAVSFSATQQ